MSEYLRKTDSVLEKMAENDKVIAQQNKRMEESGKRMEAQSRRMEAQGKRMEEQGKRMEEQGNRMEEQNRRMEEHGKILVDHSRNIDLAFQEIKQLRQESLKHEMQNQAILNEIFSISKRVQNLEGQ